MPTQPLFPSHHLTLDQLRRQCAGWTRLGWLPERERLVGWRTGLPLPRSLPDGLRINGVRHLIWGDASPEACEQAQPHWSTPGPWPLDGSAAATGGDGAAESNGPGAEPAARSDGPERNAAVSAAMLQLSLLDLLLTDDPRAARLATELVVPVWWLGRTAPPDGLHVTRWIEAPCSGDAPESIDTWALAAGPAVTMYAASHPAAQRLAWLADEQPAVQACFEAFQQGRLVAAQEAAGRLLVAHPQRSDLLHLLGIMAQQAGQPAQAAQLFEQAVRRTPGYAQGWQGLTLARLAEGRPQDALQAVQHAVAAAPGQPALRALHARVLQRCGHTALAATEALNALELSPDHPAALQEGANALAALGRSEQAAELYRRGLRQQPGAVDLHFNLGMLLTRSGCADQALPHLDEVIARTEIDHPLHLRALREIGNAYTRCGAWLPAAAITRRALALRPADVDLLRRLVALEMRIDHPERAWALLDDPKLVSSLPADLRLARLVLDRQLAMWADRQPLAAQPSTTMAQAGSVSGLADLDELIGNPRAALPPAQVLLRLASEPALRAPASALLQRLWHHMQPSLDDPAANAAAEEAAPHHGTQPPAAAQPTSRNSTRRMRVVYASDEPAPVFHRAALHALIAEHDPALLEVWTCDWGRADGQRGHGIPSHAAPSEESACQHLDLTGMTREQAVETLQHAEIDILVDLSGPEFERTAEILAHHPASQQWWWSDSLPAETPPWIDAVLQPRSTGCCAPEDVGSTSTRAAASANPMRRWTAPSDPPWLLQTPTVDVDRGACTRTRSALGLPIHAPVLACASDLHDIDPAVFELWLRLLAACPAAVLWLRGQPPDIQARLAAAASRRGIDSTRLRFTDGPPPDLTLADLHLTPGPAGDDQALARALAAALPPLAFDTPANQLRMRNTGLNPSKHLFPDLSNCEALAMHWLRQPRELLALRRQLRSTHDAPHPPSLSTTRLARWLEALMLEQHRQRRRDHAAV